MPRTTAAAPWRLAARTARMNPSVIREILKLTERPGIISLAGGLPSAETFPVEAMREATRARAARRRRARRCSTPPAKASAPLREWVAARDGAPGPAVDAGAGADHHRLAAGARPRRQGADRRRQHGRGRVADLPRRAAGVRSVRAGVRRRSPCDDDGPLPEALAASGRRALPLRAAQLPEPERPHRSARRAAPRWSRARPSGRPAARRGQPVRRPLVRRAAAAAARARAGPRARSISARFSKVLAPGPAPRLRDRAAGALPQAAAGQAGRRPAHARLQPAHGARGRSADGFLDAPRADDPRAATRRSATRCRRRSTAHLPTAARCRWSVPGGGMFFWVELPEGVDAEALLPQGGRARRRLRARRAVLRRRAAREHACGCRS